MNGFSFAVWSFACAGIGYCVGITDQLVRRWKRKAKG